MAKYMERYIFHEGHGARIKRSARHDEGLHKGKGKKKGIKIRAGLGGSQKRRHRESKGFLSADRADINN